jgi:hypothetical protein
VRSTPHLAGAARHDDPRRPAGGGQAHLDRADAAREVDGADPTRGEVEGRRRGAAGDRDRPGGLAVERHVDDGRSAVAGPGQSHGVAGDRCGERGPPLATCSRADVRANFGALTVDPLVAVAPGWDGDGDGTGGSATERAGVIVTVPLSHADNNAVTTETSVSTTNRRGPGMRDRVRPA